VQSEGFLIGDEVHIYFGPLPALAGCRYSSSPTGSTGV
jgi:hypothetical protein